MHAVELEGTVKLANVCTLDGDTKSVLIIRGTYLLTIRAGLCT